jgi:hypothetical protein
VSFALRWCLDHLDDLSGPLADQKRCGFFRNDDLLACVSRRIRTYFNTACCESLAGQTTEAIEHLRRAIDMWDGCREMAKHDSDFDTIRDEPAFQAHLG